MRYSVAGPPVLGARVRHTWVGILRVVYSLFLVWFYSASDANM